MKQRLESEIAKLKLEDKTFLYNNTEIDIAALGNDANLIGALYNYLYCNKCTLGGN